MVDVDVDVRLLDSCSYRGPYCVILEILSILVQGLQFEPGQDYHFISTSTGFQDGQENLVGGVCRSHNMKVSFQSIRYGGQMDVREKNIIT